MNMPRMRTAKEIAKEFKELDPETCISESTIRRLVKEGTLPSIPVGNKNLINLDYCIEYFNKPFPELKLYTTESKPNNVTPIDRIKLFKERINISA